MDLPSFRAYINDQMVYFGKNGHISSIIAFCEDRWVYLAHNQMDDETPTWESMYVTSIQDNPDVSLMICAEIKDSKDIYIWESDIVSSSRDDREYGIVCFSIHDGIQIIGTETNTPWDYLNSESVYSLEHLTILGNKHQNKNLLERKLYGKE